MGYSHPTAAWTVLASARRIDQKLASLAMILLPRTCFLTMNQDLDTYCIYLFGGRPGNLSFVDAVIKRVVTVFERVYLA